MQARMKNPATVVPGAMQANASGPRQRSTTTRALSGLLLAIATTNLFNRLNVTTRQVAGAGW